MALTDEQIERYSRHIILKEVGVKGQKKLLDAKVLIIGAGGLGAPAAMYLAAAGVGTIGIADADVVDLSNLQRQIIHATADVGKPKVKSAEETMTAMNPGVKVNTYQIFVNASNIRELIRDYDFVIDGTDNFPAKFLINDACVMEKKPFSHAGIIRFKGQLMTYIPGQGPCYRCVFREPPPKDAVPTCRQAGVIGAVAGILGCLQALEAVKLILFYHMNFGDAVALYNKYVGDWGGTSTTYRFEAIKAGKVVKTLVKAPVTKLHLEAKAEKQELMEKRTYDVTEVRLRMLDENGNLLNFYNEPVNFRIEGPLELVGPAVTSLRGGMGGVYVRTTGGIGAGALYITTADGTETKVSFRIKAGRSQKLI